MIFATENFAKALQEFQAVIPAKTRLFSCENGEI